MKTIVEASNDVSRTAGAKAKVTQGSAAFDGAKEGLPESAPSSEVLAERRAAAVEVANAHAEPGTKVLGKDVWVGKSGDTYRSFAS